MGIFLYLYNIIAICTLQHLGRLFSNFSELALRFKLKIHSGPDGVKSFCVV